MPREISPTHAAVADDGPHGGPPTPLVGPGMVPLDDRAVPPLQADPTKGQTREVITLGDALPKEIARIRDRVLPVYDAIPSGAFAAAMMRHDLDAAVRAMIVGDIIEMLRAYDSLRGYSL